jgi:chaperonin GroES
VKFRPLQDRVLIRRIEEEEKTAGGIIIPDTAKEKPMEGEVIAAGPGTRGDDGKLHPLDVKVGDRVLFGKWSGTEIKIDGEDFVVAKGRPVTEWLYSPLRGSCTRQLDIAHTGRGHIVRQRVRTANMGSSGSDRQPRPLSKYDATQRRK